MVRHATEETTTTTTTTTHSPGTRSTDLIDSKVADADVDEATGTNSNDDAEAAALSAICRPEHCFHAFDALYCALTHATPIEPRFADVKYPLFVTWNARTRRSGSVSSSSSSSRSGGGSSGGWSTRLRGCIGSFDPQPLRTGLEEYALLSAFRDHRFRRVDLRELPSLQCGVSLLTDFEDATSYLDWTVGVHGIQISFTPPLTSPSASDAPSPLSSAVSLLSRPLTSHFSSSSSSVAARRLSATYLPEVAPEQGWEHIDAIDSAIRKAGWNGRISEDLRRSVRVRRYQSRKCVVGWDEFVKWRADRGHPVDPDLDVGHGQVDLRF
ncbi:alport syndrome [Russula earlei]|uniref:Alport syndrome n=1 Tax=Russula earlei TaxID=71964 RepID=A0ACC0UJ52_9AGAM|nr:alport syndrome [Russula earlei]